MVWRLHLGQVGGRDLGLDARCATDTLRSPNPATRTSASSASVATCKINVFGCRTSRATIQQQHARGVVGKCISGFCRPTRNPADQDILGRPRRGTLSWNCPGDDRGRLRKRPSTSCSPSPKGTVTTTMRTSTEIFCCLPTVIGTPIDAPQFHPVRLRVRVRRFRREKGCRRSRHFERPGLEVAPAPLNAPLS